MMSNLFSVFDPSSSLIITTNWLSTVLILVILPPSYWMITNPVGLVPNLTKIILHKEMKNLLGPQSFPGSTMILITIFYFVVFNNFLGLFPYIFTSTSHMVTTLSLALPLWLSFMIFGWFNYTKYMLAHLVPQGTPSALMSFMVLIESVSNMIRPGTLAIRLSANMIAGHLLLTLLGNQTAASSMMANMGLLLTQILLLTLEAAVAVIQSYVFMVLSTLYSSESTSH